MNDIRPPIRVMFVVPCFGYGGLEQVILNIVKDLDRSRFTPSFCSLVVPEPDLFEDLKALGLQCHVIEKGDGLKPGLPLRLSRLFRSEKTDLVNAHDIGATIYAAPAARLARVPAFIHTDHSQILAKTKFPSVYGWILNSLVDFSITVSYDLEKHLIDRYGVSPALVRTIPNGIDTARFDSGGRTEELRRELGIKEGDRVIGTIGRLMKQKGVPWLLKAFSMLRAEVSDVSLVIVGDGEERENLENQAGELGISDSVIFAGIRRDIPDILAMFDIFTLASLWEGQPITIMEAMASGRPIVATDAGGNAEILDGGRYGMIVPREDPGALARSIRELLDDPERAARLGDGARERARAELSSAAMTSKYEEVFGSVLGR
jgi:glycosyltransferase involved in cell wall biosynthesis